jgi:MFS family permease
MQNSADSNRLATVLVASGIILSLAMGVRHGFGFWLQPVSLHHDWTRDTFSLAMALQNLMWGVFGPLAGMAADRFGAPRVVVIGAVLYMSGLLAMASATQPAIFVLASGILIGAGLSCTAFGALSGVVGRTAPLAKRSWAFGVLGAAGSLGQFAMVPVEQLLIANANWQGALHWLAAAVVVMMIPLAFLLRERPWVAGLDIAPQSVGEAVREAFAHRPFQLLVAGYFVCGFQVVFIGVHLPSYLKDRGVFDPKVAVVALALIGFFNIFGSFTAGQLGGKLSKPKLLASVYLARALIISLFVFLPLSAVSVYLFAAAMGLLWLSTVPLTNGVIAGMFGVRHLSMLSGFVFFSHQIGSFSGVWLGGYLYTLEGSYDTVWLITIALGLIACALNLPISEAAVRREPQPA